MPFIFFSSKTVCLVVVLSLMVAKSKGAPSNAEVKQFPGFNGELPSKHYAGYINVGEELGKRSLYYYFATSERNPSEDPLMLWINGGPGCSGLSALVHLIGPFKLKQTLFHLKELPEVEQNSYSWTKVASILFVDSPAGAGYSYADANDDYTTDDAKTVSDLYEFLRKWFLEYPEFLPNPLYLGGCSYSGVIVPVLADEIVQGIESGRGPSLNFKGYSLGNAVTDIDIENNGIVPFAYRMGLISDELYEDLSNSCHQRYFGNKDPVCLRNLENFQSHLQGINKEHILCLPCHFDLGISMEDHEYESIRLYESTHGESKFSFYCREYETVPKRLFDLESSRKMLHAMPAEVSGPWIRCKKLTSYERVILSLTPYHLNLTKKGYRAFIYSGDHDMIIPYTATLEWIKALNYSQIVKWHPWFIEDQIAGYATLYDHNLLFATFKGAGHTVTEYMPREALVAHQRWMDGAQTLCQNIVFDLLVS